MAEAMYRLGRRKEFVLSLNFRDLRVWRRWETDCSPTAVVAARSATCSMQALIVARETWMGHIPRRHRSGQSEVLYIRG
jgi:hypothetical protein